MAKNDPIKYRVTVPDIARHQFEVEIIIPSPHPEGQILQLPAWIPGSYMIRDFAKNIVWLKALTLEGESLKTVKLDKQRWKTEACLQPVKVVYCVYAFDLSVRSAFLDGEFGFANGTSLFLMVEGQALSPVNIDFALPQNKPLWSLSTSLPSPDNIAALTPDTRTLNGTCENYYDLIEHPFLMGELDIVSFTSHDVQFELVLAGGHNADKARLKRDLTRVADHHLTLFSSHIPVKRYQFQTMLSESDFGGLEHLSSTALVYSRNELPSVNQQQEMASGYRTFLSLCSHELFHTWHVKRIKPSVYIHPNLGREVHTEQLWIYEGFTSYYDDFSLRRADLITHESYLEVVAQNLTRLLRSKGRFNQTVTESSWDTWTKFYKQDENAPNAIVSYYIKGGIIAMCLDLKLRLASEGAHNLDNIMQMLWEQYGITGKGTPDNVIHLLLEELGYDFSTFLHNALYTTKELPVLELLTEVGITLHTRSRFDVRDQGGKKLKGALHGIGANFTTSAIGVELSQVYKNSPAEEAGLAKGDNLIAVNGYKISEGKLQNFMDKLESNTSADIAFFRRGRLHHTKMAVKAAEQDTIYLEITDPKLAALWLGKK